MSNGEETLSAALSSVIIDGIRNAKTPMDAAALAVRLQDSTMRTLIGRVDDLKGSVNDFNGSSSFWSKWLAGLTGALIVLTCVLTWFTWQLVQKG